MSISTVKYLYINVSRVTIHALIKAFYKEYALYCSHHRFYTFSFFHSLVGGGSCVCWGYLPVSLVGIIK